MKKIALFVFAFFGLLAVLYLVASFFLSRSGATMYAGAPMPMQGYAETGSAPGGYAAAMKTVKSPSEGAIRRMIIRNADITLQVNNIPKALEQISQLADNSKGYVVSSNLLQNDNDSNNNTATISIRVPAEGLNNVLNQLKAFANRVLQQSVSGEDITQQYVNLESQLKNLQTSKEQLTKIMAGATKTTDVLAVYQQLSETQGQIDVIEGQIKYYKESVAFSLINVNLVMNPIIKNQLETQWKLKEVFISSTQELVNQLRNFTYGFIQFVVYILPMIILWCLIALVLFYIWKKIYRTFR